jgi:chemotaxis protein CheY-P-specific phosphatase CheC
MPLGELSEIRTLEELFSQATLRASNSMARWTGGAVALSLGPVEELPPEEALGRLCLDDQVLTFVQLDIEGDASGRLLLAFDEDNLDRLAATLLNGRSTTAAESELRESALMETANILGSAYLAVLSDAAAALLLPSPPSLVRDYGASVLQSAVMEHLLASDRLLLLPILFDDSRARLTWQAFFAPSPELMQLLRSRLAATPPVDGVDSLAC